jgi:hypothetical protein
MEQIKFPEDDQLLNYLDGSLNKVQVEEVEERIRMSNALTTRLEELRTIHATLKYNATLEMPSGNFTQRVMQNLDSFQVPVLSARNGILLLVGIVAAIGVTLLLIQSGVFDSIKGAVTLDSLPIKQQWIKNPIPSFPYNGKKIMNVILIIATGLSFVLLDRTILRPWFEHRRI